MPSHGDLWARTLPTSPFCKDSLVYSLLRSAKVGNVYSWSSLGSGKVFSLLIPIEFKLAGI